MSFSCGKQRRRRQMHTEYVVGSTGSVFAPARALQQAGKLLGEHAVHVLERDDWRGEQTLADLVQQLVLDDEQRVARLVRTHSGRCARVKHRASQQVRECEQRVVVLHAHFAHRVRPDHLIHEVRRAVLGAQLLRQTRAHS